MHRFFSPAKINFFFHVIGKRLDGYHEIASLLHTVSFGDYITFIPFQTDHLTIEGNEHLPNDGSNLVIKALELFRKKTGWRQPFHIHLQKNIPLGSGLGGGSSNAATTLWALNAISKLEIPKNELQKWSSAIGSDVPFFFSNGCAVCTGRGEIVENYPVIEEKSLYLFLNEENVNTKTVFSQVIPPYKSRDISQLIVDTVQKKYPCINELEEAAYKAYPSLQHRRENIVNNFTGSVFMTGSGGTFIGIGKPSKGLGLNYTSIKKVECIENWGSWYEDRKLLISNLELKINALKNILPKEIDLSVPPIVCNASILRIYYLYRINELSESFILVQDKQIASELLFRGILETECFYNMCYNAIIKSLETKSMDKASIFLDKAIAGKIHVLDALRKRTHKWKGCKSIYDHLSNYCHPNWDGAFTYITLIETVDQKRALFGRNPQLSISDGNITLLTEILEGFINSYENDVQIFDDFKNLCIEKQTKKES